MNIKAKKISRPFQKSKTQPLTQKEIKDGWVDDGSGIYKKLIKSRKWPSLGFEVRTEMWRMNNLFGSAAEPVEIKSAYTLDSGDLIGDPKEAFMLARKYGIKPEKREEDSNVCSIGFSNKYKKWFGWSHRALGGFKPGDKVKKGDVIAGSGKFKAGDKIKDIAMAKDAAKEFALQVSHREVDDSKLLSERMKKEGKPLKDIPLNYDIEAMPGEEINKEDPTGFAVKTEKPKELKEKKKIKVSKKELLVGIEVELEHTSDRKEAQKIALDHLIEDPKYYTKLLSAGIADEEKAVEMGKKFGMIKENPDNMKVSDDLVLNYRDSNGSFIINRKNGNTLVYNDGKLYYNGKEIKSLLDKIVPELNLFVDRNRANVDKRKETLKAMKLQSRFRQNYETKTGFNQHWLLISLYEQLPLDILSNNFNLEQFLSGDQEVDPDTQKGFKQDNYLSGRTWEDKYVSIWENIAVLNKLKSYFSKYIFPHLSDEFILEYNPEDTDGTYGQGTIETSKKQKPLDKEKVSSHHQDPQKSAHKKWKERIYQRSGVWEIFNKKLFDEILEENFADATASRYSNQSVTQRDIERAHGDNTNPEADPDKKVERRNKKIKKVKTGLEDTTLAKDTEMNQLSNRRKRNSFRKGKKISDSLTVNKKPTAQDTIKNKIQENLRKFGVFE